MKNIKRYTKMERKFDQESDTSSEKQGTYYQFLIERKVPKGTLRHIASLLNVTYEFVPDNIDNKRRKTHEISDTKIEFVNKMKENNRLYANLNDKIMHAEPNAYKNLEHKRREDKSVKLSIKNSEVAQAWKQFHKTSFHKTTQKRSKDHKDIIKIRKKSKSSNNIMNEASTHEESHLSFLKNQKLIPCNLKMNSKHKGKFLFKQPIFQNIWIF
jgi:hypothetical protein